MVIVVGGEEIPLSMVRLCGMEVPPNKLLNMNESLHLTIAYLLRGECEGLEVIVLWLVD